MAPRSLYQNNRVSIYTTDGVLLDKAAGHRPAGLCTRDGLVYVAEQGARMEFGKVVKIGSIWTVVASNWMSHQHLRYLHG